MNRTFEKLRNELNKQVSQNKLFNEEINISCNVLTPEEAIGNPEDQDFPIIRGKEKLIQADFKGAKGQAFTDHYGFFKLSVRELLNLELKDNQERAIFIASLNAIFSFLNLTRDNVHCKDQEPKDCSKKLGSILKKDKRILIVGFQPRFLEYVSDNYEVRAVDLDKDNIGKTKFNIKIEEPSQTSELIKWSDIILVTGSTVVNGTIDQFLNLEHKEIFFYGTTVAAAAEILNVKRYCNADLFKG